MKSFEERRKDPNYDYYNDPDNPWWTPEPDIVKANQRIGAWCDRVAELSTHAHAMFADAMICRMILYRLFELDAEQNLALPHGLREAIRTQVSRLDEAVQKFHSMSSHKEIVGKLHAIPIGVNLSGQGPETCEDNVAYYKYELWDDLNLSVASVSTAEQAELLVKTYNEAEALRARVAELEERLDDLNSEAREERN